VRGCVRPGRSSSAARREEPQPGAGRPRSPGRSGRRSPRCGSRDLPTSRCRDPGAGCRSTHPARAASRKAHARASSRPVPPRESDRGASESPSAQRGRHPEARRS
jgi:hypothetical protein